MILAILVITTFSAVDGYSKGYGLSSGIWSFFCSTLILGLIFISIGMSVPGVTSRTEVVSSEKLSALGNDSEVGGSFFLGTGIIDEKPVIKYIKEDLNGGYVLDTIDSRAVKIFEITDGSSPRVESVVSYKYMDWFAPFEIDTSSDTYFYVPEDSVIETYRLDVNNGN